MSSFLKKTLWLSAVICSALCGQSTTFAGDMISLAPREWPMVIARQMPSVNNRPDVMEQIFDSYEAYPGSCDEIWFCPDGRLNLEAAKKELETMLPMRKRCQELGIDYSVQIITLGHGGPLIHSTSSEVQSFPEDAYRVHPNGGRNSDFCPTSPEVRDYFFARAKQIMEVLHPDSFWPDDDMRLTPGCYCDRCMKGFSEFTGKEWTREELCKHLFESVGVEEPVRAQWVEYEGKVLGEVAAVWRSAVNTVDPTCRMGHQMAFSNWHHTGLNSEPVLKNYISEQSPTAGIRPGAGFYQDSDIGGLLQKYVCVMDEAANSRLLKKADGKPLVGQICYEAENYPHYDLLKNPQFMMTEGTLMMAAGVDSLTLYWHSSDYYESRASYNRFARLTAEYRPYWEKLRDLGNRSKVTGIARPLGKNIFTAPSRVPGDGFWQVSNWEGIPGDLSCGIPFCPENAAPQVMVLTDPTISRMTKEELDGYLAGPVIVDQWGLKELLKFVPLKDIALEDHTEMLFEVFKSPDLEGPNNFLRQSGTLSCILKTSRKDVQVLSTFSTADSVAPKHLGIAAAIIPAPQGGKILYMPTMDELTAPKRKTLYDGLDAICPGKFKVRVDSNEKMIITPRVNDEGKVVAVSIFNLSPGETDTLQVRVRNAAAQTADWTLPRQPVIRINGVATGDPKEEILVTLPPLGAFQIGTLFF